MGLKTGSSTITVIETNGRALQTFLGSVIVLGAFLFIWLGSESQLLQPTGVEKFRTGIEKETNARCETVCAEGKANSKKNRNNEKIQDLLKPQDLLDNKKLLYRAESAKANLIEKLQKDYGQEYFRQIFQEGDGFRPILPITADGPSSDRLERKLLVKLLSMQEKVREGETHVNTQCDCVNGNKAIAAQKDNEDKESQFFEKYVWATGGHSASAGHGNLYNESYTAFLERDLVDVFGAVGIEFVARNYAMGGTSASPEISMCWEQIFGSDVDIFSWDFGMTDGNMYEKTLFYGLRGGLSPGHPAFVGLHVGKKPPRDKQIQNLEKLGMAAFHMDNNLAAGMNAGIPDSAGLSTKELNTLPEYVRHFKCNGAIEKGEPYCNKAKWSRGLCTNRKKKTSWHPGFKDHAMKGHGIALFLTNFLIRTLKRLSESPIENNESWLQQLRKEEDEAIQNLTNAELPAGYNKILGKISGKIPPNFEPSLLYKGRSYCHTGRLPSQTRYLGYLTNTDKVGGPAPWGNMTYDEGIFVENAKKVASDTMRLVFDNKDRTKNCPVTCMPDVKDTFLTTSKDGWASLTLPNEAERKAYRYDPYQLKGVIIVILRSCDWGKCEKGFLKLEHFAENKWEMQINGQKVESFASADGAAIAQGKDGIFFAPNEKGAYVFEIKVNEPDSFVLVSAFVIY